MKAGETIVILAVLGTVCQAAKLLKVPRIYNALITSDEKLLPSQAYPALTPIIQPIPYPGYIAPLHAILPIPVTSAPAPPGGRSFSLAVKQDYYSYNYYENIPETKPTYEQPALFAPAAAAAVAPPVPKEITYANDESRVDFGKWPYYPSRGNGPYGAFPEPKKNGGPGTEARLGHGQGTVQGEPVPRPPVAAGGRKLPQYPATYPSPSPAYDSGPSTDKEGDDSTASETDESYPDGGYSPVDDAVKNNKPSDPSIVDIPPPPLPIGKPKGHKKKPDGYSSPPFGYPL